jgi:RNA polymerase sigma factor (sigma-70 family)
MSTKKTDNNEYLLKYKSLVEGISTSIMRKIDKAITDVTKDDLVGWGFIGLLDAQKRYNPENPKSATFQTYASRRILWAIFDGLKDWKRDLSQPNIDDLFIKYEPIEEEGQSQLYENSLLYKDVQELSPRLRRIIIRRYWYGDKISEIAKHDNLTKQRIDFLEKRAVHELRLKKAESNGGKIMYIGKIAVLKIKAPQNPVQKATCPICNKEINPEEEMVYINAIGENPRRFHPECAKKFSTDLLNFLTKGGSHVRQKG